MATFPTRCLPRWWLVSVAAAMLMAHTCLALDADAVLALARREASKVPALTARAAALAEVALRVESKEGPGAADAIWQLALETAAAEEDWFARLMAGRAVAARRLKLTSRTEATAEYLREIYRCTPAIESPCDRAFALRELAPLIAAFDKQLAVEALEKAIEAARSIPEHLVRATALAEIGLVAADLDAAVADRALTEAHNSWQMAAPGTERDLEAAELARGWAAVAWEKALGLATGIAEPQAQAHALQAAAEELARRDLDKAVLAVQRCSSRELRGVALAAVAAQMAPKRPDLAALLAQEALAAVGEAPQTVRDVAVASAAAAVAPSNTEEALKLAASIVSEENRAEATVAVALALAAADPARSLDILAGLDRPELAEPAMPQILYWLARKDPDAAITAAKNILEKYLRVLALLRIFDAMASGRTEPSSEAKGGVSLDAP